MKDFPTSAKRKFTQCRQMQWLSLLGMCMRMFLVLMRLYWRRWGKRLRERGRVDDLACCQTRCLLMFRLTPEMFGFPCRRDRDYRITWDEKRMEWTCVPGQSEIVWLWLFKSDCLSLHIAYWRHIRSKILRTIFSLMGRRQNAWWRYQISWFLHLQSETCAMSNVCQGKWLLAAWFWWGWVFFIMNQSCLWKNLGRSQQVHLSRYRELCPEKKMYSLSQNPQKMKRTEDKNSYMMTFTTAMDLWCLACKQYCSCFSKKKEGSDQ